MSALNFSKLYRCSYQQGNVLRSLGVVHVRRKEIDRATQLFKEALEFHRKAQWVSEQASDLRHLSVVYQKEKPKVIILVPFPAILGGNESQCPLSSLRLGNRYKMIYINASMQARQVGWGVMNP
ncbi:hypothetical protein BDN70DRAFT_510042 [Pholiota conissans]|uniref:Uncharacterized protein n=1 Tax=Pholiota conissans TaxID=109636 RepID=A0A9P5YMH1_9AGAR|nr:hypothetical protein BDN70DRAFT_510042 [Pholiota conissans]